MKYIFLCLSLFLSNLILAQNQFLKGSFINNENQKTECFIKYEPASYNPTSFEYKINENDDSKIITIKNIKSFEIDDISKYLKATVELDRHTDDINRLEKNKEIVLKTETHLLKLIVDGFYKLYVYEDNEIKRFFYSKQDDQIKELQYKVYNIPEISNVDIAENLFFQRQLYYDVKCSTTKITDIEHVVYKQNQLENYFEKVNECTTGIKSTRNLKKEKGFFKIKISGDCNFMSLAVSENQMKEGKKTQLTGGLEVEYLVAFYRYKISFFLDANYYSYNSSTTVKRLFPYNYFPDYKIQSEISSLSFPIGTRFNFSKNLNKRIYLDFGGNLISFTKTESVDDLGNQMTKFLPKNGFVSAGFEYKKFGISFRHYVGPGGAYLLNRDVIFLRYEMFSTKSKEK